MPVTADRCMETSTTTGTGAITLAGAVSQYRSFNSAFGPSSAVLIQYAIVGQTGTEWECGIGYLTGATTLTREKVYASSNSGALVNFSAGTKNVFATALANAVESGGTGRSLAAASGLALS